MIKIRNKKERRLVVAILIFSVVAVAFAFYLGYTRGDRERAEKAERARQSQQL